MKHLSGIGFVAVAALTVATMSWGQDTGSSSGSKAKKTEKFETKTNGDAAGETDIAKRLDNSATVLNEIMGSPDKGIPSDVLADTAMD